MVEVYKNLGTYARHYLCLRPLYAKDHDCVPVCQAIWKPTPKIFGVTYIKCSLVEREARQRQGI